MTTPNTTMPLPFWKPGEEERQLRVFISHRYGGDRSLYDDVIAFLGREGFKVQDLSLSEEHKRAGPRGGRLTKLELQAEVAARIYSADIVIAPSRPAIGRSEWVMWEVQLAAIGYSIPVLFVKERDAIYTANLVAQFEKLGAVHKLCEHDTPSIVRNTISLVGGRPTHAVRAEEDDAKFRLRGPSAASLAKVMNNFPYRPALADVPSPEPPKRGFWDRLSGKGRGR